MEENLHDSITIINKVFQLEFSTWRVKQALRYNYDLMFWSIGMIYVAN